jgi:Mor family transcriptional regulator
MRAKRDPRERADRNQEMLALRRAGMRLADIAKQYGVSEPRVHQLVEREKRREQFGMNVTELA